MQAKNSKSRHDSQSSQVVDNSARKRVKRTQHDKKSPSHHSITSSVIKKEEKLDLTSANAVPLARLPSNINGFALRFKMNN